MAPGPAAMEQLACRPHQRCHSGCAGVLYLMLKPA